MIIWNFKCAMIEESSETAVQPESEYLYGTSTEIE